jgi:tRNA pseudouridine38-40 synthase
MATTRPWRASSWSEPREAVALTLFSAGEEGAPAAPAASSEPSDAPDDSPRTRIRLLVAYDGAPFRGFAPNRQVRTVSGDLTVALERVLGHRVVLTCAGRTDAGVHAWGQVVTFDALAEPATLNLVALQRSLLKLLSPSIVVREVAEAEPGFDARRWATARLYRYSVLNRRVPDPFLAGTTWHVEEPLDLRAMQLACDPLYGEHEFSSFCRKAPDNGSLVRRIVDARWLDLGDGLMRFDVEASSFCQQMVRSLVGTMVDVGLGRRRAGEMSGILAARDRSQAGPPAPPHGLCLWEVRYPDASNSVG